MSCRQLTNIGNKTQQRFWAAGEFTSPISLAESAAVHGIATMAAKTVGLFNVEIF